MKPMFEQRWDRFGLTPALLAFIIALIGLPFAVYWVVYGHAQNEALRNAQQFSRVISTFRSYYATNVAGRILDSGGAPIVLTENYHQLQGGVPIPATLSIELGDLLAQHRLDDGFSAVFLSDAPFKHRQRAPLDDFQKDALAHFRSQSNEREMWRVERSLWGRDQVRLAIPVKMEATCVACHNGHPQSPRNDWKVGDVRGLQDITVALALTEQADDTWLFGLYLVFFVGSAAAALREHKMANALLVQSNEDLTLSQSYLEDSEYRLKLKVDELRTLTTVMQKAPFGITFADPKQPDMPLVYANDAFLEQTGYTLAEVLGHNCRFLQGPDTRAEAVQKIREAIQNEETAEIEILNYRKNGEPFWNRFLVFPSYDSAGHLLHFVGCQTDITVLKQAEQERQAMEAELQESMKLEYLGLTIAGIAHDLNTPIGVAVTAASHVEQQVRILADIASAPTTDRAQLDKVAHKLERSATLIGNNLNKAATLVRSFKQTTADASRNEWRTLQIRPFMDSVLLALSPLVKRARCSVELNCADRLEVYTEPGSLMQVVTNLVVNATLHAFEGQDDRRITVTVAADEQSMTLEVKDNGKGMSEDALAKAFTPFFTTRRQAGGSGLGLFSSRRAVESVLGGRISVTSVLGEGTSFLIRVPRQHAPAGRST